MSLCAGNYFGLKLILVMVPAKCSPSDDYNIMTQASRLQTGSELQNWNVSQARVDEGEEAGHCPGEPLLSPPMMS